MYHNNQILQLYNSGLTVEQIAETLNLEVEAVSIALRQTMMPNVTISADQLIEQHRPEAINFLVKIIRDDTIENVGARVKAAQIIVERKGVLPALDVNKWSDMMKDMKQAKEAQQKVLEEKSMAIDI